MNASDAAALHERTKHTWQRLRANSRGLDWANHPFPFKLYPDLEPLPLPRQLPESGVPATKVLSGQVSVSAPASPLDLAGLARLLFFAAGVTRILHGVLFRAAPSAGALYPTELYAVCGPLADLPAGVYHFAPAEFALRRLRDGDFRARLAASAAAPAVAGLPLCLVLTGIPWRTTWKYRERGYATCSGTPARSWPTCWRWPPRPGGTRACWPASSTARSRACSASASQRSTRWRW
jgi:hypothetical protein